MQDFTTNPLPLYKKVAGSGVSRLEALRAKYSTNNIAQQQASYQKLLVGFPEHNRNQYLLTHIHCALNLNQNYDTIKADLLKLPQINRPSDPITEAEIDRAIERTKESREKNFPLHQIQLSTQTITTGTHVPAVKPETHVPVVMPETNKAVTFETLKARSPYALTGSNKDAEAFLKTLFKEDEYICIGGVKNNHPCQVRSYLNRLDSLGEYITINPFTPDTTRSDKNVAFYRHMLVEFDVEDKEKALADPVFLRQELEKQAGFWMEMLNKGMPIISLTYSGSKSIHALFRVNVPDAMTWEQEIAGKIYPIFCKMGADPANKNPSRLSRMPMALRNGVRQELLYLNQNTAPMTPEELLKLLGGIAPETTAVPAVGNTLFDLVPAVCASKMTEVEKIRTIHAATSAHLKSRGAFLKVERVRDSIELLYLDHTTHIVRSIHNKIFQAQLSKELGLPTNDQKFIRLFSYLENDLLASENIPVVTPRKYWHSTQDAIYISCNDHEMVRITTDRIEIAPNGTDHVIFLPEAVLEDWTYTEENYHFWQNQLWKNATIRTTEEKSITLAWTTLLPFAPENKPILCIVGEPGSGKTKISKGAAWLWGVPAWDIQPLQDENKGLDNFGIGVDKGGIALMDNVDTVYKWLPDTLAKYSTGEVIRKRKLYSDKEQIEFRGEAALVINSVKPYFASDPGCNARLMVVRMNTRETREERDLDSELKKEILIHRNASLSMICRQLQQILADKVRVTENFGLRHNDWGEYAVKLGRVLKEEKFMKSALLKNQENRMDIVLENNALAAAIESYFSNSYRYPQLEGYTDDIRKQLAEFNSDFAYYSNQKFTSLFTRSLVYLQKDYDIKEKVIGGVHRTRYTITLKER
ncbi:hypothetical protein [uncultured Victivallis sp.]|uniref:hypothetical protein n=1 Tax=uncultured Victivallis sp. TaxID=354118 RepID=UPI0025983EEE|nr:hypothetical protein [uncultured Victivallis sp.]